MSKLTLQQVEHVADTTPYRTPPDQTIVQTAARAAKQAYETALAKLGGLD